MKQDLLIFGIGGFGQGVLEVAEAMNDESDMWNILGFLDDDADRQGETVSGYPVLGGREWLHTRQANVVVCLGSTSVRRRVVFDLSRSSNVHFAALIHPRSTVSRRSKVGDGSVVFAGAVIDTHTRISEHVLVGRNASLGHDLDIGDYVNLFPSVSLSGHSFVGEGCEIGTNATVIPGVRVGAWSVVGAGAVVARDLEDNVTAVGMPAKEVKRRDAGWHLV